MVKMSGEKEEPPPHLGPGSGTETVFSSILEFALHHNTCRSWNMATNKARIDYSLFSWQNDTFVFLHKGSETQEDYAPAT